MRTRTRSQRRTSMPNRRSPRSPLRLKNSAVCGRTRPLHLASAPRARLGTAPPCTALPSTRLEGCSRLTLPSPLLYRTTRARHGGRGLPRLFPGRRCALRPASCCLSAAGRNQPHTRRRHASASRPAGIAYEPTNRADPTGTAPFPLISSSCRSPQRLRTTR